MTGPFLQDPDVTLLHGDVLDRLRELPDESVDCCITSPPYWGLRDYGTGTWEGGNQDCDHRQAEGGTRNKGRDRAASGGTFHDSPLVEPGLGIPFRDVCRKCGARRIDNQLGLEPTPDLYIARMVDVFREVRRVLAGHGTCWVNMGDGYASQGERGNNNGEGASTMGWPGQRQETLNKAAGMRLPAVSHGLKPKDLVGMPWRLAFALQADGWYLRADIIWAKPNPMPESVTDRPTKAHEYVFLLTKLPRYWFDQEAVREPYWQPERMATRREVSGPGTYVYTDGDRAAGPAKGPDGRRVTKVLGQDGSLQHRDGERWPNPSGRNIRSVWEIATQPYPEAHFATYPEELVRRCLLAGCPEWVCRECGKPRERIVEREFVKTRGNAGPNVSEDPQGYDKGSKMVHPLGYGRYDVTTLGWSDCGHGQNYRPGIVLDPFMGSGTTALVARNHGRHAIGIDLRADYLELAARRLQQLSLLAETR